MSFVIVSVNQIDNTEQQPGLGIDLNRLSSTTTDNILSTVDYNIINQVRNNLVVLLQTQPTERIMLPEYGCNINKILFQPNTDSIKLLADQIIRDDINKWLPYINVLSVNVITVEDNPSLDNDIQINIEYSIIGSQFNGTVSLNVSANGNRITI